MGAGCGDHAVGVAELTIFRWRRRQWKAVPSRSTPAALISFIGPSQVMFPTARAGPPWTWMESSDVASVPVRFRSTWVSSYIA